MSCPPRVVLAAIKLQCRARIMRAKKAVWCARRLLLTAVVTVTCEDLLTTVCDALEDRLYAAVWA